MRNSSYFTKQKIEVMEREQALKFSLSLVFQQDEKTGDYTAFYAQFPEATAQGRTKEEAKILLDQIFPYLLQEKREEFLKYHSDSPLQILELQMQATA